MHLPHPPHPRREAHPRVAPHEGAGEAVVRQPPIGEVRHGQTLGTGSRVAHRPGLRRGAGERLLAADVQPRAEGGEGHRGVQVVGHAHDDRVEVGAGDERLPAGLDGGTRAAGRGDALGEVGGAVGVAPAERDDLGAGVAQERGQVHALDPPARADDGDAGGG